METKEVTLTSGKKIVVSELKWIDVFSDDTRKAREGKSYQHVMLQLATKMTDDEINDLNMKDGSNLFKVYMELNEATQDFQMPQENDKNDLVQP